MSWDTTSRVENINPQAFMFQIQIVALVALSTCIENNTFVPFQVFLFKGHFTKIGWIVICLSCQTRKSVASAIISVTAVNYISQNPPRSVTCTLSMSLYSEAIKAWTTLSLLRPYNSFRLILTENMFSLRKLQQVHSYRLYIYIFQIYAKLCFFRPFQFHFFFVLKRTKFLHICLWYVLLHSALHTVKI